MMGMYIQRIGALLCCLLFISVVAIAQGSADKPGGSKTSNQANNGTAAQPDTLSGKFEGIAKSASLGEIPVTLELQNQAGKVSGKLESPHGVGMIKEGTYDAGRVAIKFDFAGDEGVITGQLKGDAITGDWSVGDVGGTLELKRVTTAAKPATAPVAATATVDNISGEWDATADANGEPFPFSLKLKLDGDKVTGESSSSLGGATISKGSWVNGTLTLTLDGQGGATLLTGSLKDGKLIGNFDYAGQFQGKWGASKKSGVDSPQQRRLP